jgi:hypothetical protein
VSEAARIALAFCRGTSRDVELLEAAYASADRVAAAPECWSKG